MKYMLETLESFNKKHPKKIDIVKILNEKGFTDLIGWLKQISKYENINNFIYYKKYKDKSIYLTFFTKEYAYNIHAHLSHNNNHSYLGACVTVRKPRAGEDWNRGNDLSDGSYSEETWNKIKNDIISFELVKVVRNNPQE